MSNEITGYHAVEEALKTQREGFFYASGKGSKIESLIKLAKSSGVPFKRISPDKMGKISANHRGFCFVPDNEESGKGDTYRGIEDFIRKNAERESSLVFLLDNITDPHNLGAILRSADLFGIDLVVLPARRSASKNDTVARTSSGASEWVPVITAPNLSGVIEKLKENGFWIYGADMDGTEACDMNLKGKSAIVMGSEGDGLSRLVKEKCDGIVSIPVDGHVDSLNVSVAAGILMYEARR